MSKRKNDPGFTPIELFLFTIVVLLSSCLILEFTVPFLYQVMEGVPFPRKALRENLFYLSSTRSDVQIPVQSPRTDGQGFELFDKRIYVIHPYLGYVENQTGWEKSTNRMLGWPDEALIRADGRLVVGLFGGSVAKGVYTDAGDVLVARLQELTGKQIYLVNFSEGGYKQPQQVLALTYLLTQGAQFDVVINLDGFNEVTLPPIENVEKGVYPLFPRSWYFLMGQVNNPDTLTLIGEMEALARWQTSWAQFFVNKGLYDTNIFLTLWWAGETKMEQEYNSRQIKLLRSSGNTGISGYEVTGPVVDYSDDAMLFQTLASTWRESSMQMHALSQGNGIQYFHFLQPNQYVANSKPIAIEEAQIAFAPDHPYRRGVEMGYPYLIQYGQELVNQGIHFHDLTMIFAEESQHLYKDTCCHLTEEGYRLIVERIVELMVADGFTGQ